ncbi:MAG: C10 family peptidase [Candidatus Delongbacteria bacterium]|jgi:hypothetical protein|nr:C10 family peptidase [Candidatus Delongbacteria bacterium]
MKKFLLFILSLTIFLSAAVVPVERAQKVAENYYKNYAPVTEKGNAVQKILTKTYLGQPTWYVVQFTEGWVIVSADDAVRPILGYSFDGKITEDLSNMQNPFVNRFSYYDRQIVHTVRERGYVDGKSSAEWKEIENNNFPKGSRAIVVDALIETKWGQGWPWNEMCPTDSLGKCPAGPVAIAMAQIMMFHCSAFAAGSIIYLWDGGVGGEEQTISVSFSNADYTYGLMPILPAQYDVLLEIDEVSKLMYHCAASVETQFSSEGSGAFLADVTYAFEYYFCYDSIISYNYLGTIVDPEIFSTTIRSNLDNYEPLIWGGSGLDIGHAFILDGYTDDYWYHFNWGWEGNFDGWFQLTDLTPGENEFTYSQSCVNNIFVYGPYPPPEFRPLLSTISDTEIFLYWEPKGSGAVYNVYSSADPYSDFILDYTTNETSWLFPISEDKKFFYVTNTNP